MMSAMVELAFTLVSASGWSQAGTACQGEEAEFRNLPCKTQIYRSFRAVLVLVASHSVSDLHAVLGRAVSRISIAVSCVLGRVCR